MIKILFVCLGNICRSPMAEAIFKKLVKDKNLEDKIICDSSGTSDYHIGEDPDERTLRNARVNGLEILHKGRQVTKRDLYIYNYVLAMDRDNLKSVQRLVSDDRDIAANIYLMREFDGREQPDVPDPYFGGEAGFQNVYDILYRSCSNFLDFIIKEHGLQ